MTAISNAGDKTYLLAVTATTNTGDKANLLAVTATTNAGDKTNLLAVAATTNAGDKANLLAVTATTNAGDKTNLAVTATTNTGNKTNLLAVASTTALRARDCVSAVAQQYSTASLRFHSCKEKLGLHFKNVIILILFYCHFLESYASLKLHNIRCVCIICYLPYKVPYKIDKSIVQKGMLQAR